jgi:hypothetical protein
LIPNCHCPYCQHIFQPSPYRVQQRVCRQAECQRRRRADYHRQKIRTDPLYAQVVQDSRKQWRSEHADYQKTYWKTHPEAAERNRQRQRRRDRQDRVTSLVKKWTPSSIQVSCGSRTVCAFPRVWFVPWMAPVFGVASSTKRRQALAQSPMRLSNRSRSVSV